MKPILKWAGGKARLAPQIDEAFTQPCEGTYYEPFAGSCAVFLHLKATGRVGRAVLSDANDKLMEVHRAVRDDVEGLLTRLRELPRDDWRERYYEIREAYNDGPGRGPAHAARFIWLNRAGYNGLYRENRSGDFNVPLGRYAQLSLPADDHFREVARLLRGVELWSGGFEEVLDAAGPGDHVYCDPPYVPLSDTACFTGYYAAPFGIEEQRELAAGARRAALRGARVVLSNHDLPVVRNELYPRDIGFEHVARPRVARAISRNAARREAVAEVIAAIGPMDEEAA